MLRYAGNDPAQLERVGRLAAQTGADMTEARRLAAEQPEARRAVLLEQIDGLQQQYQEARTAAERRRLGIEITRRQMEANFYTPEAYIGPGAGLQTVLGRRVSGHSAYQAGLSHLAELSHIVAEHGNNLVLAARQYEFFKYMNRLGEAARQAGMGSDRGVALLEQLGLFVYRADRSANAAEWAGADQAAIRAIQSRITAQARSRPGIPVPFESDPSHAPIGDDQLRSLTDLFQSTAESVLGELHARANDTSRVNHGTETRLH